MYQLKQMLNDLVDYTFADDPKLKAYRSFYIEVVTKDYKGRHGDYTPSTRHIRLMNTYRDENKLIITSVHELAHHINHMQGNTDVHGKGFYANYEKLLHGTLDMGLVKKEEWLAAHEECHDSQSENKVQRMIERYQPKNAGYKAGKTKFTVYDAFDVKEELKEKGFKFNKIVKGWEIELDEDDTSEMKLFLDSKDLKYNISGGNKYIVKDKDKPQTNPKKVWTLSVLNAYPIKDKLKEKGFRYRKEDYCWCIQYSTSDELSQLIEDIQALCEENGIEYDKLDSQKYRRRQEVQAVLVRQGTEKKEVKKPAARPAADIGELFGNLTPEEFIGNLLR